jgi:hypothetical protein
MQKIRVRCFLARNQSTSFGTAIALLNLNKMTVLEFHGTFMYIEGSNLFVSATWGHNQERKARKSYYILHTSYVGNMLQLTELVIFNRRKGPNEPPFFNTDENRFFTGKVL